MNKKNTLIVDSFDAKKRLDVFLALQVDVSRSKIKNFINAHGVELNGELTTTPHKFLVEGDKIVVPESFEVIREKKEKEVEIGKYKVENVEEIVDLIELDIMFQNDDVIVINKPAGALVHPTASSREDTIMNAVVRLDPEIATVGDKPEERAGIVHRLDRMTSGVMIIARNQMAFEDLKNKFQKRYVRKKYRALLDGELDKDEGVITLRIARNKALGRMVARPESQAGRDANTEYKVLQRYANATEADVDIHTGRTHQIRAHFHALGNPVVGDKVYKIKNQKTIPFPRLWLHAYHLELALPGEEEARIFTAPVPEQLTDLTSKLHKV